MHDYDYDSDNNSGDLVVSNNVDRFVEYSIEDLRQMAQEEPEHLQLEQTDEEDSLDKASLDPYPEAYRLGDQVLRACI